MRLPGCMACSIRIMPNSYIERLRGRRWVSFRWIQKIICAKRCLTRQPSNLVRAKASREDNYREYLGISFAFSHDFNVCQQHNTQDKAVYEVAEQETFAITAEGGAKFGV
jgi:hypothetical protein